MRAIATTLAVMLVVALAGCTVERQVLGDDNAPLTMCEEVWAQGVPGAACDLPAPCTRADPIDPMCCTAYAYCRMGVLVMDTTCNPDCSSCIDDHGCTPGAAFCNGTTCEPCSFTDPTGQNCPMCPMGWVTLTRNGCPTCDCAPPSECTAGGVPDMCDPMDPNGGHCYQGHLAEPGCALDDPGCSANVCSLPGCMGAAPLGCFTTCDPTMTPGCNQCATDSCSCSANGIWSCTQICVDQAPISLPCFF